MIFIVKDGHDEMRDKVTDLIQNLIEIIYFNNFISFLTDIILYQWYRI